jgi:CRISPR-associated protein Cas1
VTDTGVEIPISLVAHFVFCPRRAWLESVGEKVESVAIEAGSIAHRSIDEAKSGTGARQRSVQVRASTLGVVGTCDEIEVQPDGSIVVTEYKSTPIKRRADVSEAMVMQLTLQGLALESAGYRVTGHRVWFTNHRVAVDVPVGEDERVAAAGAVAGARGVIESATAPPALEDDARCLRCSHVAICLPDERLQQPVLRPIQVADPDTRVLHLATQGSRASLRRGRVVVAGRDGEMAEVPLGRVAALVVHGNCDVSAALLRELLWRDLPVVWCSSRGRVVGWASSAAAPNGVARVRQQALSAAGRLDIGRAIIAAKIGNQATLLRRNGEAGDVVSAMRHTARKAAEAPSLQVLLGLEGAGAAAYFSSFESMLKQPWARFDARRGRGATDAVNVALNIAYGLLVSECIRALVSCGLDPHAGFVHSPIRNKPALALDLCEEFRPTVADSAVVRAINNGELREADFTSVMRNWRIQDRGRRAVVSAMEHRLDQSITHPIFGYKATWRRVIEVQARQILGVVDGTQESYRPVVVR